VVFLSHKVEGEAFSVGESKKRATQPHKKTKLSLDQPKTVVYFLASSVRQIGKRVFSVSGDEFNQTHWKGAK
jgi:hypothetical protein